MRYTLIGEVVYVFKSMKNIMKSIIFLIILVIVLYILPMLYFGEIGINSTYPIYSKDVEIYQVDEEKLQVVENIVVDVRDANEHSLFLPISIYKDYKDGYVELIDTKITINNEKILTKYENETLIDKGTIYNKYNLNNNELKNINRDIVYSHTANFINISTKDNMKFGTGKHTITISYKCNINDVVTNYNNIAILKLTRNTNSNKLNITLNLPIASSSFDVCSNKATIENLSDNTYKVNLTDVIKTNNFEYVSFTFDNNVFLNAKKVYENYDITKETSIFANEKGTNEIYFFIIATSTVIIFIATLFITKKVKLGKNYVKDTKMVISPMLAETLIDGKMGSKELIMTCIVELICRGNIQNIDNDKFKLISRNNLLDYEEELVNMLFETKSIISLNDITDMFINNNKDTSLFVEQFKQIKKKILDKLFELKIYSKKGERILELIRNFSVLVYVNIIILTKNILYNENSNFILILAINIITLLLIKLYRHLINNKKQFNIKSTNGKKLTLVFDWAMLLILSIMSLIYSFNEHYIIITLLSILVILNTISMFKSRTHILTKRGEEEYIKVYGLKSYIVDFSLMDEKDVDGAIIWNEYLAYAVAFSIPNKITSKFKSTLMKANVILQNIDKFLN